MLSLEDMRAAIAFIITVGIVGAALLQKQRDAAQTAASAAKTAKVPATAPATPSEHNWPKRALDRATDVKREVAEQRKSDETR